VKALIDADILPYEFGNMEDLETGGLLPLPITLKLVDDRIQQILTAVEATSSNFYLTDSKANFRNQVATILPYKGHRDTEKPPHWEAIRQHLIDNYDAEVQYGIEADDAMGIAQTQAVAEIETAELEVIQYGACHKQFPTDTIICSRDKDMDMIPGWHYSWECGKQKERKWFVDDQMGIRSFYKQLLTGDSTDNILGLFGVGKAAACVKRIDTYSTEQEMFAECYARYSERFGYHGYNTMLENAQLLWILRNSDGDFYPQGEIEDRLEDLHCAYQENINSKASGDAT